MQFSRRSAAMIKDTDPPQFRTRQGRVHSKSVSSPLSDPHQKYRIISTKHKTPPPPPRPPISASMSSHQLSPYHRVDKDADNSPTDLHLVATQSWSANEDDEKLQANDRPPQWRRSATMDLSKILPATESKKIYQISIGYEWGRHHLITLYRNHHHLRQGQNQNQEKERTKCRISMEDKDH